MRHNTPDISWIAYKCLTIHYLWTFLKHPTPLFLSFQVNSYFQLNNVRSFQFTCKHKNFLLRDFDIKWFFKCVIIFWSASSLRKHSISCLIRKWNFIILTHFYFFARNFIIILLFLTGYQLKYPSGTFHNLIPLFKIIYKTTRIISEYVYSTFEMLSLQVLEKILCHG